MWVEKNLLYVAYLHGFQMKYTSSTGKPRTDGDLFNKPWKMNRLALIGAAVLQKSILRDAAVGEPQ